MNTATSGKRIAWQNPITRGLTSAIIPVGNAFFDCVSNKLQYGINTTVISTGIGSTTLNGKQYWNFVFNRVLSIAETNALLADPTQIFSLERVIGVNVVVSYFTSDFLPSDLRRYVVPIETRRYSIPIENRSFVISW
jgi:hypothetical protein